jgi:signal transduction histidine kinase
LRGSPALSDDPLVRRVPAPSRTLGIRARLLLVVAATLLLFATATAIVLVVLHDVTSTYERLLDVDERLLLDATRLRLSAELQVTAVQNLADPAALETIAAINRQQARVLDELDALVQTDQDRQLLARIRRADDAYDQAVENAAAVFRSARADVAVGLVYELERPEREFLGASDAFIAAKTASRDAARQAANRRLAQTGAGLVVVLAVGGGMAAAVLLGLGGRIARGVTAMAAAVRQIAVGDLDVVVPRQTDPELAALATDVEALQGVLRRARWAEERHRERVQIVRDAGRALLAAPDLSVALGFLAERAGRALGALGTSARLVDAREERIVAHATYGLQADRRPDARTEIASDDGALHGELLVWRPEGRPLGPEETDLLDALAVEAGLALRNAALAEAASRRAGELDEFVRVIAHDVRGPISLAQRLADLIRARNPILAAAEAPLFARLGDATAYAEGLIDDLRELVRAGRVPTRRQPVAVGAAAEEVVTALGTLLAERGIVADVVAGEAAVLADPRQLRQVLSNLVENAAKHMGPCDEPRVQVQATVSGAWCRVGVLDNGRGVPPDQHDQVFLPFRRGRTDGPREPGMGIGLAIARRIVQSHGGTIWIESSPAGGAAFYFTLPAVELTGTSDDVAPPERSATGDEVVRGGAT